MNRSPRESTRISRFYLAALLFAGLALGGCLPATTTVTGASAPDIPLSSPPLSTEVGSASYYHDRFEGRTTANGEIFSQQGMTAAHRTYPFGTIVRIVHMQNGRAVTVRINDRGPYSQGRIIDLSRRAAEELGMIAAGTAKIRLEVLQWGN